MTEPQRIVDNVLNIAEHAAERAYAKTFYALRNDAAAREAAREAFNAKVMELSRAFRDVATNGRNP